MFDVVFLTGPRAGEAVQVVKTMIAGRSPDCSLEVPDANASRQHARLVWDGAVLTMLDNGSSNGTYVNDQRLPSAILNHGDVIRLGETRLRIQSRTPTLMPLQQSSIFGFKDQEADLGQSILMRLDEARSSGVSNVEVLTVRYNAVIAMSKALTNINNLEEVFRSILDQLFTVFTQADRGFLMLGADPVKLEPKAVRTRGTGVGENLTVSTTICRKAIESKAAFLFNDQNAAGFDQGMSIVSLRIHSAMTIPLMIDDKVLGLLQIDTHDAARSFNRDDLELAIAASQQAAIAVNNALQIAKIAHETNLKNNLSRFVPGALAEQVISGKIDINLGGSTYLATILFSDIIGFTSLSEKMSPEQLVGMMNAYFERVVPCILSGNGSVDKFIGDAIMGVWGVPIDKGSAATDAVASALAMQAALVGFNSQQASHGGPNLGMGIGLNSGTVVAGNIGFDKTQNYTVLGDTVNTAQRLESAAGRDQVLISQNTWTACVGAAFGIAMPPLRVKNKSEPLTTYSVRGLRTIHDEIVMHLPVRIGTVPAYLLRRLADRSFVVVHPAECDICAAPLVSDVAEWPGVELGRPEMVSVLPLQTADGKLIRSQIRLPDDTVAGLLGDVPLPCSRDWDQMVRASAG